MTDATNPHDTLLTLAEVCEHEFRGTITPSTLRAARDKGTLQVYRIGKRDFTTRAAVRQMVELCRVQAKAPAYISTRSASNGLSATARATSAQAALRMSVAKLKSNSRRT